MVGWISSILTIVCLLLFTGALFSQNLVENDQDTVFENLLQKNKILAKKGDYKAALQMAHKLAAYGEKLKDTAKWLQGIHRQAFYNEKIDEPYNALKHYSLGIALAKASSNQSYQAKLSVNKANILTKIGDYKEAQKTAVQGIEAAAILKDSVNLYKLHICLANASSDNFEFDIAENAYTNALRYTNNENEVLKIKNNLGVNHKDQGNFEKAIEVYRTALADKSLPSSEGLEARIKSNLGFALHKTGNYNEAVQLLNEAHNTRQKINDWSGIFASNIHLSTYYREIDEPMAYTHAQNAFTIAKQKIKSPYSEMEALAHIISLDRANKLQANRYILLSDSLSRAKQKSINDYTAAKFQAKEQELEIARQKEEIAITAQNLAEKQQREILIMALLVSAILVGFVLFRKFQKEKKDRKTIEQQKNKIELLQKELHHRLKNNLSFIDLFISLAKGKFNDPAYHEKLNDLQNRIASMFTVHQQLFNTQDVTRVHADKYLQSLVENAKNTYPSGHITFKTEIEEQLYLEAGTSFPIGIIVNEFITNSLKYAFPKYKKGTIFISLTAQNDVLTLHMSDNGVGLPEDFTVEELNSFGIDTMRLLALEHKGNFSIKNENGVSVIITLSK